MELSLNELQMLAIKAARGAGLEWGLAEDAGFATKWLAWRGQDGAGALCKTLSSFEKANFSELTPQISGENWSGKPQVSAILAGVRIAGRPSLIDTSRIQITNLDCPLFLLPFLKHASHILQKPIHFSAGDFEACLTENYLDCKGKGEDTTDAQIFIAKHPPRRPHKQEMRARLSSQDLQKLNNWAKRIYAPATESSRLKGAGEGSANDNE